MTTQENFCNDCGAANPLTARFCLNCGSLLPFTHLTGELPEQTLLANRYQLKSKIGQGGMGAVYQAADTGFNDRPVAIKEMSSAGLAPNMLKDAEDAFTHEAHLLAGLLHPNLPRIYDHFTENDRSYLVMDFIEGQTMEDFLDTSGGGIQPGSGGAAQAHAGDGCADAARERTGSAGRVAPLRRWWSRDHGLDGYRSFA